MTDRGVSESYIDQCAAATESIDVDALSQLEVGRVLGQGNLFSMWRLGRLPVAGAALDCGLKVPNQSSDNDSVSLRLQGEIGAIELLLRHMPEHAPKVPRFMNLLAVEGRENPVAILTEDATRGGELPIWGMGSLLVMSDRARSIKRTFRRVRGTRVDVSAVDHSLAFMVGEEERFLDFSPPPVHKTAGYPEDPAAERLHDLVYDGGLTITISPESPLSRSLAAA